MARPRTPAGRAGEANERLARRFPGTAAELCALDHGDAFQLLAATILSAQCTDERVNRDHARRCSPGSRMRRPWPRRPSTRSRR